MSARFVLPAVLAAAAFTLAADQKPATIGSIDRKDPALDAIIPKDAKIEVLAGGFKWTEGPVWVPDAAGGALLFSDTNLDTWGYIYVVIGAIVALAGLCVFWRIQWARWVGIIVATIGAVSAFFWLFSPQWAPALAVLLINVLVLHGLVSYGDKEETSA